MRVIDAGTARILSAAAHGAIAFGFFGVGFLLSLAIAGVIWLYGKHSPQVRFHSEQAGCYQCGVLAVNVLFILALSASGGFSIVRLFQGQEFTGLGWGFGVGLCLFAVWFILTIGYGIFAAVTVMLGRPFKYVFISNRFHEE